MSFPLSQEIYTVEIDGSAGVDLTANVGFIDYRTVGQCDPDTQLPDVSITLAQSTARSKGILRWKRMISELGLTFAMNEFGQVSFVEGGSPAAANAATTVKFQLSIMADGRGYTLNTENDPNGQDVIGPKFFDSDSRVVDSNADATDTTEAAIARIIARVLQASGTGRVTLYDPTVTDSAVRNPIRVEKIAYEALCADLATAVARVTVTKVVPTTDAA